MGKKPKLNLVSKPPETPGELSERQIELLRLKRFNERFGRVLEVMKVERIDFAGQPFFTQDGRVAVRVIPVEMQQGQ